MFSTRTDLMPHQVPAVAKLLPSRVGALFMDMGTGKSRTLIELARIRQAKWDRFFWFTPCALRDNVREQLLTHTDLLPNEVAIWDSKALSKGAPNTKVAIVGIESMGSSTRTVLAYSAHMTESSFVAVDESTYIKGDRAKRTQRITHMSEKARYRAILTGTPFTQGAVDLYSQMKFLSPKILGYRSFWSFAKNHLEYEEKRMANGLRCKTGRIIRSHNEDYLAAKIAPYAYQVRKDECLDLPEKLYETRGTAMTTAQRALYEQAKSEILAIDYDEWSPIQIFHLFTSLQTIVCGFWKRPDGSLTEVDHNRLDLLLSTVAEIPENEQVIIWAKYRTAVHQISEALGNVYGHEQVCPYQGSQTAEERAQQIARWRAGARFLVATQAIGGHGLTLTEAAYVIFYADSFKYSERIQAEDRNHRIGQARRPVYISLYCIDSIDSRIESAIQKKANALDLFQNHVNLYRQERLKESAVALVKGL
jgi:SNF2 family DNA or RNA helicase